MGRARVLCLYNTYNKGKRYGSTLQQQTRLREPSGVISGHAGLSDGGLRSSSLLLLLAEPHHNEDERMLLVLLVAECPRRRRSEQSLT